MGSALEKPRCGWACCTEGMLAYHDREWGVPRLDDRGQFEFLVLESAQAGLSWRTVLERREGYRRCFAGFDPQAVARFGPGDVERLLQDRGIVRNRLKIEAAVANARSEVIDLCSDACLSNMEDGVARYLDSVITD